MPFSDTGSQLMPRVVAVPSLSLLVGVGLLIGALFDGVVSGRPLIGAVDAFAGLACLAVAAAWSRKLISHRFSDLTLLLVAILAIVPNVVSVTVRHASGETLTVVPFYLALVPLGLSALLVSRFFYASVCAVTLVAYAIEAAVLRAFDPLFVGILAVSVVGGWMVQQALRSVTSARAAAEAARAEATAAKTRAESLATLGTLVGSLSHEINNPLTFIQGYLDDARDEAVQLLKDPSLPERSRAALETIRSSLDRAEKGSARVNAAMRALLLLSERPAGREVADVNTLLADVLLLVQMRVPSHVELALERGPPTPAHVDPRDLFEIVLALLADSSDACASAGGKIRVQVRAAAPDVLVIVEDGAPPQRVDAAIEGTLSMKAAKTIAQSAGGEIRIEHVRPQGTRRVLRIPGGRAGARVVALT